MFQVAFLAHFALTTLLAIGNAGRRGGVSGQLLFWLVVASYALLVAFRPIDLVPDANAYYLRYNFNPTLGYMMGLDMLERSGLYKMNWAMCWLFYLSSHAGLPYEAFVFICVLVQTAILCFILKEVMSILEVSFNAFLGLLLVMIFFGLSYQYVAFAESFAIVLGAIAFYCVVRRRVALAVVLSLLSILFHSSGIVNLIVIVVVLFFDRLPNNVYRTVAALTFIFLITGLSSLFGSLASQIFDFLSTNLQGSFVYYQASDADFEGGISVRTLAFVLECFFLVEIGSWCGIDRGLFWKCCDVSYCALIVMALFAGQAVAHRVFDVLMFYSTFCALFLLSDECRGEAPFLESRTAIPSFMLWTLVLVQVVPRVNVLAIF